MVHDPGLTVLHKSLAIKKIAIIMLVGTVNRTTLTTSSPNDNSHSQSTMLDVSAPLL